jgi:choline-glycine betaine transporter
LTKTGFLTKGLTASTAISMFAVLAYLAFWYPQQILYLTKLSYLPGWFLLALVITPAGNVRLGSAQSCKFSVWLGKILLIQASLILLFFAFIYAFMGAGPEFVMGSITIPTAIRSLSEYYPSWGLFPWGLMVFWAVFLAYFTYVKRGVPHLYHSVHSIVPKFFQPILKSAADGCLFSVTSLALGLAVTSSVLLLVYFIEQYISISHLIIPVVAPMVFSFVIPLLMLKRWRKRLATAFSKHYRLHKFYTLVLIVATTIFVIAGIFNNFIFHTQHNIGDLTQISYVKKLAEDPVSRFVGMFWGWWLLWTPLIGSYIASISKGRSLRQVVMTFLALLLFLYVATMLLGSGIWLIFLTLLFSIPAPVMLIMLGVVNFLIIRRFTRNTHTNALFIRGFMPLDNAKVGRIKLCEASKTQGLGSISISLMMTVFSFSMLHCIGGWYAVQIQILAAAPFAMILALEAFIVFLIYMYKDKLWLNNQNIAPLQDPVKI